VLSPYNSHNPMGRKSNGICRSCGAQCYKWECPFCIEAVVVDPLLNLMLVGKGRPGHIGPLEPWSPPSSTKFDDEERERRQIAHEAYVSEHPRRVIRSRTRSTSVDHRTNLIRAVQTQRESEHARYGEVLTLRGQHLDELADYELEYGLKHPAEVSVETQPVVVTRSTTQQLINKLRGLK